MDRERLKQVQQTDLTESRVNQEFLDWLRNKGPTWLLVILIVLLAWVAWGKYQDYQRQQRANAFFDLENATQADGLELVASDHESVGSVAHVARLGAADLHLYAVQTHRDPEDPQVELDENAVAGHLDDAGRLYLQVYEATKNDRARRLFAIEALFGLASVAESGPSPDAEAARGHYAQIIELAGDDYPPLVAQAQKRLESLDEIMSVAALPERASLPRRSPIDPLLRDLFDNVTVDDS